MPLKFVNKKYGTLHDFACHPCTGAMLNWYKCKFSTGTKTKNKNI